PCAVASGRRPPRTRVHAVCGSTSTSTVSARSFRVLRIEGVSTAPAPRGTNAGRSLRRDSRAASGALVGERLDPPLPLEPAELRPAALPEQLRNGLLPGALELTVQVDEAA